ncbi:hypothetical protein AFLA_002594 [Aspergillus flavus NRRL3357]|nr:hypothetical protein AFLA_002594 [Aspergillus flavus NRRL3357]
MKDCDRPCPPIQCIAAPSSSSFSVHDWWIAVQLDHQLTLGLVPTPRRLNPRAGGALKAEKSVITKVYTTLKIKVLLILALTENIHVGQPTIILQPSPPPSHFDLRFLPRAPSSESSPGCAKSSGPHCLALSPSRVPSSPTLHR